ncbi:MAG: tetratricopeptide repeat protein, partial [Desulfobulbales bacterium]|nr:tetratricopeptide repeat protein [Desulfobulbales bacterium]
MTKSIFNKPIINVLLIVVLSIIAYANTFSVPFHYDDKFVIVNNPIIKDLGYFAEPSEAQKFTGWFEYTLFKYRYISYLSFALNYRFHGLNPEGYHYVNLFIHICTALLLYSFIMLTFKTPFLRNTAVKAHERHIALLAALLFACHPLQTEAVTYIWQRVASLSTLLYLLSLVMYIKFRLLSQNAGAKEPGPEQREKRSILPGLVKALFYLASLVSAVLAMKTKEIAFMLPVMLILYDLIFLKGPVRKRIIYYIPFLFTMLIIPLSLLGAESHIWDLPKDIQEQFKMETPLSTGEYLLAEFRVLVTYLRLVFLPVKQNFYYDYSRYSSFFDIEVLSSFVFLASLLSLGLYILFRYRDSFPHVRLISYGVLWFFVNLLIESSVITLNNVIYEHRMYLPSAGVFSALSIIVFMLMVRWKAYARLITSLLVIIIIVLTGATFARNGVWKSEISLWSDVVSKSPSSLEARVNLGDAYRAAGLYSKAITEYEKVAEKTRSTSVYNNLGLAYQSAGQIENALISYKLATEVAPEDPQAYSNIANIHMARGETDKAIELYQYAIRLNPNISELHAN